MNIINIFELSGMPADEKEQNVLIDAAMTHSYVHIKAAKTGKYYVARITHIDESKFESIRKLDPNQDTRVMADVFDIIKDQLK